MEHRTRVRYAGLAGSLGQFAGLMTGVWILTHPVVVRGTHEALIRGASGVMRPVAAVISSFGSLLVVAALISIIIGLLELVFGWLRPISRRAWLFGMLLQAISLVIGGMLIGLYYVIGGIPSVFMGVLILYLFNTGFLWGVVLVLCMPRQAGA